MTTTAAPTRPTYARMIRWSLGSIVAVLTIGAGVAFAAGAVKAWDLVVLRQHFGNPFAGVSIVAAGGYLAIWLLAPLRSEASQHVRLRLRVTLVVLFLLGLVPGGVLSDLYRYEVQELARSPGGERTVAVVTVGGLEERQLQVWDGSGLLAREIASLGRPCGAITARFAEPDLLLVDQGLAGEAWPIELDPETGMPRQVLAPHCADPPVPATLEP